MRCVRVVARWAMISLVGVAMAAFMVFDVLDLDGSDLSRETTGTALTADPPVRETDRLLSRTPDPSSASGSERVSVLLSCPTHAVIARVTIKSPTHRTQRWGVHLHAWRDESLRGAGPSPSDPA